MYWDPKSSDVRCHRIVQHPRQLLYRLHHLPPYFSISWETFIYDYLKCMDNWLNALSNMVAIDTSFENVATVIQDFEDLLHLNDAFIISCNTHDFLDVDQFASIVTLVNQKFEGNMTCLFESVESFYFRLNPYFLLDQWRLDIDVLSRYPFSNDALFMWLDHVMKMGFWSVSQTYKLHETLKGFDDSESVLSCKIAQFFCVIDFIKNFILFSEYCLGKDAHHIKHLLEGHLYHCDTLSEAIYMKLFEHMRLNALGFPGTNMKTIRFAGRLKTLFDRFGIHDVMIGVSELDDGRLMYGVSGPGHHSKTILDKSNAFLGSGVMQAPFLADTTGYMRLVRVMPNAFKTHNGFECVETKLFQGARNVAQSIKSMVVTWQGDSPKRYCVEHSHLNSLAHPCPGCVLNLRKYMV